MNFNVFGISRRPPDILGQLALTTFATALNNVSTKLGAAYHAGSGILTVLPGDGAKFPPLVSPDFYAVTVIRGGVAYLPTVAPTDFTVFKVTGISGDNLTVSGLLDGTLDRDYAAQDVVELRVAATLLTTLQDAVNNVEYAVPPITSVFNRAGAVTAAAGDYAVGQVTGAAPLANPTFTGVPSAPTAAVGTNTTQLATTAFVIANAGAAGAVVSVFGRTGTVTAAAGDYAVGQVTGAAPLASPTFTGVPLCRPRRSARTRPSWPPRPSCWRMPPRPPWSACSAARAPSRPRPAITPWAR